MMEEGVFILSVGAMRRREWGAREARSGWLLMRVTDLLLRLTPRHKKMRINGKTNDTQTNINTKDINTILIQTPIQQYMPKCKQQ